MMLINKETLNEFKGENDLKDAIIEDLKEELNLEGKEGLKNYINEMKRKVEGDK